MPPIDGEGEEGQDENENQGGGEGGGDAPENPTPVEDVPGAPVSIAEGKGGCFKFDEVTGERVRVAE